MARIFCIPGAALLFAAFVLNCIVTVSLPYLPIIDITRTHFQQGALEDAHNFMTDLRFGIWTPCYYNIEDDRTCAKLGYAYNVTVSDPDRFTIVNIAPAWTRGLAIHPAATAVSLLATALALSEHVTVALVATLTAWLASLLTFVAFIVDLVLYGWTKHQFSRLDVGAKTDTAPGLWITLIAFALLFAGGLSTCFGRIKDRRAKHRAADSGAIEAAHARDISAATATAEEKAEKESEKVGSDAAADVEATKTGHWASKFKFGKKAVEERVEKETERVEKETEKVKSDAANGAEAVEAVKAETGHWASKFKFGKKAQA